MWQTMAAAWCLAATAVLFAAVRAWPWVAAGAGTVARLVTAASAAGTVAAATAAAMTSVPVPAASRDTTRRLMSESGLTGTPFLVGDSADADGDQFDVPGRGEFQRFARGEGN